MNVLLKWSCGRWFARNWFFYRVTFLLIMMNIGHKQTFKKSASSWCTLDHFKHITILDAKLIFWSSYWEILSFIIIYWEILSLEFFGVMSFLLKMDCWKFSGVKNKINKYLNIYYDVCCSAMLHAEIQDWMCLRTLKNY